MVEIAVILGGAGGGRRTAGVQGIDPGGVDGELVATADEADLGVSVP